MSIPQNQSSDEWKNWRNSHIGASDIACILGKSKWATPLQLWQRKVGFLEGIKDNWAMKRGRDLEPVVRDKFNKKYNSNFVSEVLVNKELEWASASLDGIDREYQWDPSKCGEPNLGTGAILEIKCPGLADHQTAELGEVPEHYWPQIQWQMFVSQMNFCFYVSYYKEEMCVVCVDFDEYYITSILPKIADFNKCLVEMTEPEISEDDFIQIVDPKFEQAAREWKAANELAKTYAEKEKFFKEKLVSFSDDSNCCGYGIKLERIDRTGNVNWKELWKDLSEHFPEESDQYDPEDYRSDKIGYWKISKDKK